MILVRDILPDARRVLGQCSNETLFSRLSDATEILANKANFDPLIGWVDITVSGGKVVTLPREVETVLALNISGFPSFPRDRWAEFHLNGRGSDCSDTSTFFWDDKGDYPIFRDLSAPVRLVAIVDSVDMAKEIWVYGYDSNDKWVYSTVDGQTVEGYKVPVTDGLVVIDPAAPLFKKVVTVRKDKTSGFVTLNGYEDGNATPTTFGYYEPFETQPQYRRIVLSTTACWVRIQYRKKIFRIQRDTDYIPLQSRYALLLMLKSLQKLDQDRIQEADAYEAKAVRMLLDEQYIRNPAVSVPIQVNNTNGLVPNYDRLD